MSMIPVPKLPFIVVFDPISDRKSFHVLEFLYEIVCVSFSLLFPGAKDWFGFVHVLLRQDIIKLVSPCFIILLVSDNFFGYARIYELIFIVFIIVYDKPFWITWASYLVWDLTNLRMCFLQQCLNFRLFFYTLVFLYIRRERLPYSFSLLFVSVNDGCF